MMKRMLIRKPVSKMAGLTLLETMFGIAIGALILIAAVIFYTSTKNSQNVSRAVTDINTIVAQADNYIAPGATALNSLSTNNGGNAVTTLQGAGYLPNPMYDPWGANQYSATVTVTSGSNSGIPGKIAISINSLLASDSACNAIATAAQGTNSGDLKGGTGGTSGVCSVTREL